MSRTRWWNTRTKNNWGGQGPSHSTNNRFKERNFDLETESTKLGYDANPTEGQETVELLGAEEEARTIQELMEKNQSAVDYFKLQPKRANWDLKRDLQEDLDQLDRETDKAIDALVRERIRKATGDIEDQEEEK